MLIIVIDDVRRPLGGSLAWVVLSLVEYVTFFKGTVTIMVLANALSYQNASGPFNNGPTKLT